jgi:hypothetical protein
VPRASGIEPGALAVLAAAVALASPGPPLVVLTALLAALLAVPLRGVPLARRAPDAAREGSPCTPVGRGARALTAAR